MSVVTVEEVRLHLRQTQTADDNLLQLLIDGAEDEAKQYLDRDELPRRDDACVCECESDSSLDPASNASDLAPVVRSAIFLMVQAMYDGLTGDEMEQVRVVAFSMLRPYRCRWGV